MRPGAESQRRVSAERLNTSIVPSAKSLYLLDGNLDLEHVSEEVSAEWTKCSTLGGPRPKPDFAFGLSPTSFTEEEIARLKNHTSPDRTTSCTENMYFLFLVCEAKQDIDRVDRKNAHSSSIAANAIVQLYRAIDLDAAIALNGQLLVFSISHNNQDMNIYEHYAVVRQDRTLFYRYPIESIVLQFHEGRDRRKGSNFTREVYKRFYPQHVKRIQHALSLMEDSTPQSIPSQISVDESEPHGSAPSSPESGVFKIPAIPSTSNQQDPLAYLMELMAEQGRSSREHITNNGRYLHSASGADTRRAEGADGAAGAGVQRTDGAAERANCFVEKNRLDLGLHQNKKRGGFGKEKRYIILLECTHSNTTKD